MKISKTFFRKILFFLLVLISGDYLVALNQTQNLNIAKQLGWIPEINQYNLCGGYYNEIPIPFITKIDNHDTYNINADNFTYSIEKQYSVLNGNVVITGPENQITADHAYIFLDKKTNKAKYAKVFGNVRLKEKGKLIVAKNGNVDIAKKTAKLNNITYRVTIDQDSAPIKKDKIKSNNYKIYKLNAWGQAADAEQVEPNIIDLHEASYTTCPPNGTTCWQIKASKIRLNKKTDRGYSTNMRLYIKDIPVFYFPYFNFPISKKRQTGFLFPSIGDSSRTGSSIQTPYYINLAPNYDSTITPTFMSKRGILWNALFRYLTPFNEGNVNFDYIYNDKEFKKFKEGAENKWQLQPTYNELERASNNRYSFSWKDDAYINKNWHTKIDFNHVSDDYFIEDFDSNIMNYSDNQLLKQFQVDYGNQNWDFIANVQGYQTLHPVDQTNVENQYARLPQLQLNGTFDDNPYGLIYAIKTEAIRFDKNRNPFDPVNASNPVVGNRYTAAPEVSLPIIFPYAQIIPKVKLQLTQYNLQNYRNNGFKENPYLAVPIFSLDGQMHFDRNINIFKHKFKQTLEPEFYYLYTPYHNQTDIPLFNTQAQSFNYDYMFLDNRFSGYDRVGDANQITLALTTRFIDDITGEEKASASIGQIEYFKKRKVTTCASSDTACAPNDIDNDYASPIAAKATYNLNPNFSFSADAAWSTQKNNFNNESFSFTYKQKNKYSLNFGYYFTRGEDKIPGAQDTTNQAKDLEETYLTAIWRINNRWGVIGRWDYNLSYNNAKTYEYGISYESCCWAVRLMGGRSFIGIKPDNTNAFSNSFAIQFELKGLGDISAGADNNLFTDNINNMLN